jgi:uncharacterized protein (TIGR00251 family)
MIRETAGGIELNIRVIPRARKSELAGVRGEAVLVRLAAPPVEGAANAALIELLSRQLDVPRRSIRIVSGERSRDKRVRIAGVSAATAAQVLGISGSTSRR